MCELQERLMSFLSPLFLAGALAAAVPIVLHLLKREPEARVKFSAVKLLRSAPVEHASRRHLRELLLLALRVAALLLLALAFARPFLTSGASARGDRRDGRGARHVAQPVGARPVREGAAAGDAGDRHGRRAIWSPSSRSPTSRTSPASRPPIARWPGAPSTPRGPAPARRAIARRSTPPRRPSRARRARSSS